MAWCSTFDSCQSCTSALGCDWCFDSRKCVLVSTLRCAAPYADDPADCALDPLLISSSSTSQLSTAVGNVSLDSAMTNSNVLVQSESSRSASATFFSSPDERSSSVAWSSLDVGLLTAGLVLLCVALVAGIVFAARRQRRRQSLATPTTLDGETRTPTSATMGPSMSNVDLPHSTPVRRSSTRTDHYAAAPALETGTAVYSAAPQLTISIANQSYVQPNQ